MSPVTRIVSDMVIVRRMVYDVLKLKIMVLGVVHEKTHGVRTVLFLWTSASCAWSPGAWTAGTEGSASILWIPYHVPGHP